MQSPKTLVYLTKSSKPYKKYMVRIKNKTIHFGASGYSDYTKHKSKNRMKLYETRHRSKENWNKTGIRTAGFWSKWLLWNKPTLKQSIEDIQQRFNIRIIRK